MKEFFSWQGRLNRRPYFFRGLALGLPTCLLYELPKAWGVELGPAVTLSSSLIMLAAAVLAIFQTIKRWHDLDRSGWHTLLMLLPLFNFLVGLFLTFKKGTAGANRFGEDLLAQASPPAAAGGAPPRSGL